MMYYHILRLSRSRALVKLLDKQFFKPLSTRNARESVHARVLAALGCSVAPRRMKQ